AVAAGAEGVGLLRTELLFLDRPGLPDEEEQVAVLREIAGTLEGRPLVVRTLDVGADKPLPALRQAPEANPFLGVRGVRLSLARPEEFAVQLRAIARVAAEHASLRVMFPMVATLAELRAARAALSAAGAPDSLQVGMMVEVPAAALHAERFAREVDFLSIGTNDLAQYVMAAERGNAAVAGLTDGPLPALLRLVAEVTTGARSNACPVGVCGELAGEPLAAALLVGLGVQSLSIVPALVPEIKEALRGLDAEQAGIVARRCLELDAVDEVRDLAAGLLT
nr:phosphoenolpyruvate--protein phosphotransferase [Solirubrobacterales bacterium]